MSLPNPQEEIWSGPSLNNPANVTRRSWRTTHVDVQSPSVEAALRTGTNATAFVLHLADGSALACTHLSCLIHLGMGEETVHRFEAWAPLAPEAAASPTEHWRLCYHLDVHANGLVEISVVEVAPDRASHRSRPRPSLP